MEGKKLTSEEHARKYPFGDEHGNIEDVNYIKHLNEKACGKTLGCGSITTRK